jgi:LPS sulfotransferase NodH
VFDPSRAFVIVSPPRAGSTLLRLTLNGLDDVRCHGELLNHKRVSGLENEAALPVDRKERRMRKTRLLEERARDPVGFVQRALSSEDAAASGFKMLYHQFENPVFDPVISWLTAERSLRIVLLWRNDELRRYVSERVLRAGGPAHSGPGGRSERLVRVKIDPDTFLAETRRLREQRASLRGRFERHSTMDLSYEDLVEKPQAAIARTAEFVGAATPSRPVELALAKVGATDLAEVVTNLDELRACEAMQAFLR